MSPRRDFITSFRHRVAKVVVFAHFRGQATFGGKIHALLAFLAFPDGLSALPNLPAVRPNVRTVPTRHPAQRHASCQLTSWLKAK